jgi:hypothetical protein
MELEENQNIPVKDLRKVGNALKWDSSGIAIKSISDTMSEDDFDDENKIRNAYYPEIEQLLYATFNPSKVVIVEHIVSFFHLKRKAS